MSTDNGFEHVAINPLSTFRKRWPVAGMPDAPQVIVWRFHTAYRALAKFEVIFHAAVAEDLEEQDNDNKSRRPKLAKLQWPGSDKNASKRQVGSIVKPVVVHAKTNISCHVPNGEVVAHFACYGTGFMEFAWTNGFSPFQRQLSYHVSFARTDPLALAEPGDATLCNLATQVYPTRFVAALIHSLQNSFIMIPCVLVL